MNNCSESLLLRALMRRPVPRTPVWMMRQAGRYLPEYRKIRKQAGDFLSLCKNPELACEVTLQPLRRYALDAAILFSDILTIPDALGLGLYFTEGEGPGFHHPLRSEEAIARLPDSGMPEELGYVMDAVRLIRQEMPAELPLIGFAGSPWTLACYMVEGSSSRDFKQMIKFMYNQPEVAHNLLQKLARIITAYLSQQVIAGANVLMIFDTWGGLLTPDNYQHFSLNYMSKIVNGLKQQHPEIPIILFTKGGSQYLEAINNTGCNAVGLDWTCDLRTARQRVGYRMALQGNLDPSVLLAKDAVIRQEVQKVLSSYGHGHGHVFNLGHGITPDVLPESVQVMIDAVREFSPAYHEPVQ